MKRTRLNGHKSNDLFDLDGYLEEKASEESSSRNHNLELSKKPTVKRNMIAIGIIATFFAFWTFISVPSFFISLEDDKTSPVLDFDYTLMQPPVLTPPLTPEQPITQNQNFHGEYSDYLEQLNVENLDIFNNSATQSFYSSGVPIQYLKDLEESGLITNFSYSAIIGLYVSGVPVSYLTNMSNAGFLDDFSYSAIIGLYSSNVTISYLQDMQQAGFLDDFSYSAIIGLYSSNVTISYLEQLQDARLLDQSSYSAIIGLYSSNVPVSFLEELRSRNLLNDMSYGDVIRAYNIDK